MKILLRSNLIAALAGASLMAYAQVATAPGTPSTWTGAGKAKYVQGEVLVKFKPAAAAQNRAAVAALGHSIVAELGQPGWTHVKLGAGQSVADGIAAYQNEPSVETVQPNYIYHASAVPNDPQFGQLWALKNTGQSVTGATFGGNPGTPGDDINIEAAWDHITDCSSVIVAVVDTGVNYNQEDLAANMWNGTAAGFPNHGFDFSSNDNDPMDLNGHGTHVAGIIGASGNNSTGTTGVCWTASIMAVRVLDASGTGTDSTIIQGINFAIAHGAKVINMSLGSSGGPFDSAFSSAISSAQLNDVVVVVAAGNDGVNNDGGTPTYPCNFLQSNILCVAALDQKYALASFSNFGVNSVDVGAPGTNVLSTWAGAESTINETFNTGGALNWTTSGGGWAYASQLIGGNTFDVLTNPSNLQTGGQYLHNADNRVYKTFNLSGQSGAVLNFLAYVSIETGDSLNVNYRSAGGDPFAGGVQLQGGSGTTGGIFDPFSFDITPCIGATCSIGFQLKSGSSSTIVPGDGGAVIEFSIQSVQVNTNTYKIENGTSMATPMVAGLATMLRAYNPKYTYVDTVNAIKNGGKPIGALLGNTTSGRAIDVMSTLAFINFPAGLSVAIQ